MKFFRTTTDPTEKSKTITWENYVKFTGENEPYVQKNITGGKSFYAICPGCKNPIQLVGMVNNTSRNPYGKHAGKAIPDLRPWDQVRYEVCPLRTKGTIQTPTDDEKEGFLRIDDYVIDLYNLLKNQFDIIEYIICETLGIRAGGWFWENALRNYQADHAYCYRWLTDANLPYVFAHFGMQHMSLWSVSVNERSELYKVLASHSNVEIFPSEKYKGYYDWKPKCGYLKLEMRFYDHRIKASQTEKLVEYLQFCIDDRTNKNTIFEKTLEYDELTFQNIREKRESKRQPWLLKIAADSMKGLQKTE